MGKRILVVEDEQIIGEDIKRTLEQFGYSVIDVMATGEKTLQKIDKLNPDMILMDIMLGGTLTGIETANEVLKSYDIPILYLTAYANEKILEDAKLTQPYGYIIKPFEEKELRASIEMAFYRHQMENTLKESEKKYRILFNNIIDPIFIFSKEDLHFLDCNNSVISNYGYSKKELKKMTPFDLHPKSEYEKVQHYVKKITAKPVIYNHLIKEGKKILVEVLSKEITYEGKSAILSIAHNISERIKAKEKLKETQERLSVVFKNVPNIILYEIGGSRRFISENIIKLLGYQAEEFIKDKKKFTSLIHKDDRLIIRKKINAWKESGSSEMLTLWYRIKHSSGSIIWIEDRMVAITPADDKKYITGVLIDNSDLKKADEALKISQSRFKAVVEDQTEYIARFLQDTMLTFVNKAYCRFAGKSNEDLIGTKWLNNISTEKKEYFLEVFKSLTIEEPVATREFETKLEDGTAIWTEWTFRALFDENGNFIEFQSVGKDITDRKNAEVEKQKIHDFNNLLTAINGYADLAKAKLDSNDPAVDDITVIKECGEKAAKLTQQLLGFSRRQITDKKIIDLNVVIQDLNKMLTRLIGQEIELKTCTSKEQCIVNADPGQIEQVLVNLIVNARDAKPKDGIITISTINETITTEKAKKLGFEQSGKYTLTSVQDIGSGIPEDIREKIFEPFFTTKELGKGTGLGLATVYGIIKQNDGHIIVESEIGKGTCLKFYLPYVEAVISKSETKAIEEEELPRGNETILLVEDEESIREFVASILEEYGYNILEAINGEEGLQLAKDYKEPIDLLLSDIRMPKMSGPKLSELLKNDHPETKALFISGHTDDDVLQEISRLNAGFLHKPFSSTALVNKVREVLDTKRNLNEKT
jgi:PAS domain S-box-containing protein